MQTDDVLDYNVTNDETKTEIEMVDVNRFLLLSLFSLGLYNVWWMYKSWRFFKEKDSLDIFPVARAIFAILFIFSLFQNISLFADTNGYKKNYSSGSLTLGFIIFSLSSRLPDPFWIVSVFSCLFLIQPVAALNFAIKNSESYTLKQSSGFNGRQIFLLIIGAVFWALIIWSRFLPQNEY